MPQDMLEQLRTIDLHELTEIVRQDQRNPTFELTDWTVDRLSSKGMINPDGLFRFSGQGRAEQVARPWCVVLKIVQQPEEDQNLRDIWYRKREMLAAQHHLLERLPGPIAAPASTPRSSTRTVPGSGWSISTAAASPGRWSSMPSSRGS